MFSVASGGANPCGSLTPMIAAGGSCTGMVTFAPTSAGAKSTTMRITSNDPDENPKDVTLSGTGVLFTVTPNEGTYGTEVLIKGQNFGSKKGKVPIGNTAVKVLEWTATTIKAVINKAMSPSLYDVTLQRKEPKGAPDLVERNAFAVRAPEMEEVSPAGGTAGETIIVTGRFFGTKKGKVHLAGRSCKVVGWEDTKIEFVVAKKLPTGAQELKVVNAIGQDTAISP